ncbi:dihydrofolate reductase [Pedobacter heparinus]|uniref:Dihydrofolate reductase n=1 Tax=Pedobacter heparinus (strain ATCC 13125 / DSM 2366 / CIP 104194 / JCM 7457 / NBRC 12017 / NCIMB 9290 / NRRL B-14731 / HIM 762-3) TaxID=485917 RepID=C6XT74_PEDHD|nr:dihydrofolate reductase [Pedobacter heparinus]ACU03635.1 Dihydrofolate reductase [Pedobacter heparinus DSM 2366]
MTVSIVVAIAENNAIGKNNELLWHLPTDLKHFKQLTSGHTIIMGRKTFDSIGKPLPNRRNIVITRSNSLEIPGAEVVNNIDQALALCTAEKEVFIVGGAEIYRQAMDKTDKIYLTTVHAGFEGDAYFPEIDRKKWEEVDNEPHQPDEKNNLAYTFSTLLRK